MLIGSSSPPPRPPGQSPPAPGAPPRRPAPSPRSCELAATGGRGGRQRPDRSVRQRSAVRMATGQLRPEPDRSARYRERLKWARPDGVEDRLCLPARRRSRVAANGARTDRRRRWGAFPPKGGSPSRYVEPHRAEQLSAPPKNGHRQPNNLGPGGRCADDHRPSDHRHGSAPARAGDRGPFASASHRSCGSPDGLRPTARTRSGRCGCGRARGYWPAGRPGKDLLPRRRQWRAGSWLRSSPRPESSPCPLVRRSHGHGPSNRRGAPRLRSGASSRYRLAMG